ncbi:hypothetical protein, partial [Streptomyces antibioticus]|uniref:hypothetical protein n=1 Tax=Streptomyces antibioticus TaxID=1890 RepID=UPI0033D0E1D1
HRSPQDTRWRPRAIPPITTTRSVARYGDTLLVDALTSGSRDADGFGLESTDPLIGAALFPSHRDEALFTVRRSARMDPSSPQRRRGDRRTEHGPR